MGGRCIKIHRSIYAGYNQLIGEKNRTNFLNCQAHDVGNITIMPNKLITWPNKSHFIRLQRMWAVDFAVIPICSMYPHQSMIMNNKFVCHNTLSIWQYHHFPLAFRRNPTNTHCYWHLPTNLEMLLSRLLFLMSFFAILKRLNTIWAAFIKYSKRMMRIWIYIVFELLN